MTKPESSSLRQRCIELAAEPEALLFANGYDEAIVGIGIHFGIETVVYDEDRVLRILRRRDGMTADEAEEFFEFNVMGAWVGERTPLFIRKVR